MIRSHPDASEVVQFGLDTSGRPLLMTRWMHAVLERILEDPRVKPFAHLIPVVQGAWMARAGGGANASGGFHDFGGCLDLRLRNITTAQAEVFIWVASEYGFEFWRRGPSAQWGGFPDPHLHGIFIYDFGIEGHLAQLQVNSVFANDAGLDGPGVDYERRLRPIPTLNDVNNLMEDDMADEATQKTLARIETAANDAVNEIRGLKSAEANRAKATRQRDAALLELIEKLAPQIRTRAGKEQIANLKTLLQTHVDEPEVTP